MASIQATTDGYENHILLAKIAKLYLKAETADVYFVFGEDDNCERVPAHKCLLAAESDVFNAMFYGDLKEKGDVKITDASADAFKEFLQFFYRTKVNLTEENVFDVVNLGKKYDVAACQNICDRFLEDKLIHSNDSVCSVYSFASYFDLNDVKKLCESMIIEDTEAVFKSSSFLECDHSVLNRILKFDKLSCSEVNVFHACMNWVKAKAKREKITREIVDAHLGDLFYEIRFRSMTMGELADLTPSYGKLFSFDEYKEVVQMIRCADFQPKWFKRDHRRVHVPWNSDAVMVFERTIRDYDFLNHLDLEDFESTTFTTNKSIWLGEITCALIYKDISAEMTIYEISDDGTTKPIYNDKHVSFSSWRIVLTKPILIKPEFKYDITFDYISDEPVEYSQYALKSTTPLPHSDIVIKFISENDTREIVRSLKFNLITEV